MCAKKRPAPKSARKGPARKARAPARKSRPAIKAVEPTVRLPFIDIAQAYVTNVVEENQAVLRCGAGAVAVPVDAWGITTIRVLPR